MKIVYDAQVKHDFPSRGHRRATAGLAIAVAAIVALTAIWLMAILPGGDSASAMVVAALPVVVVSFLLFEGLRHLILARGASTSAWDQREAATAVLAFGIAAALVIGVVYADLAMMVVVILASLGPRYALRHAADRASAKGPR